MKVAMIQMPVTADKSANQERAACFIAQAARDGADLAVLPEMFLCPYDNKCFPQYAEEHGGTAWQALAKAAEKNGIAVVGGSIPERDGANLYNTSFVFGRDGKELAFHRKMHLFDIDVEGGQQFKESDVFTAGNLDTLFELDGHTLGLCICFDIRFPELFRKMALKGAEAVIVPAAFNMTTGPLHWELTFRARALDNQLFTVGVAPARDEQSGYVSYANSIVCDPWGRPLVRLGTEPRIETVELDFSENNRARAQLPLLSARRPECY